MLNKNETKELESLIRDIARACVKVYGAAKTERIVFDICSYLKIEKTDFTNLHNRFKENYND